MSKTLEVERWFEQNRPPAESALRRVRDVILGADPRLTEQVKYWTVVFAYQGDVCSFVQWKKPGVNLMFNRGARIPGKFPHLEGGGPTARFMRFADVAEVEARAAELGKIAAAWCRLMDADAAGAGAGKPRKKPQKTTAGRPKKATRRVKRR